MRVVFLKLNYFLESFPFYKDSESPTEGDFHDVGLEVIVGKSEVEVCLWVFLDTGDKSLLEEMITKHLHVLDGVLIGGHGLVETVVIVQIVLLPLFSQAH